jgi:hypothetical protein
MNRRQPVALLQVFRKYTDKDIYNSLTIVTACNSYKI